MLTVRIEQCHGHRLRPMTEHHLDEFARGEVEFDVIGWDLDQAKAGKAAGVQASALLTVTRLRIGSIRISPCSIHSQSSTRPVDGEA